MIGNALQDRLDKLEEDIKDALVNAIESHGVESEHIGSKALKINVFGYTELVVIGNELTFLDSNGLSYSLWNGDMELEDLINILNDYEGV